jgi:hypothetical protein
VGREVVFTPTKGNDSLLQDSNDSGVRIVNFDTATNLVKGRMFPHRNTHKYIWTHNQIDQMLTDRRRYSSLLDVRSFMGADCDIDHYLALAKVREILAVNK